MNEAALAVVGTLVLTGFHLFTPLLERLPNRYQEVLQSAAGGAGLAYVSVYLLFELVKDGAPKIYELVPIGPGPLEALCVLLLAALTGNYILQMQIAKRSDVHDEHRAYTAFFFAYNVVVGAGLVEETRWGALNLSFYVAALGLHLVFNDLFLHHLAQRAHDWRWRALLAAGPIGGAALAFVLSVPMGALYALLAWIAGGTLIHVFRRELPDVRSFRPLPFLAGVLVYASLVFSTWRF